MAELLINAIEHGDLGVTFQEKTDLLEQGTWLDVLDEWLRDPRYAKKMVEVSYQRTELAISFAIKDEGQGFDRGRYLDAEPSCSECSHGRGIMIANLLSFDQLNYVSPGNQVIAKVALASAV